MYVDFEMYTDFILTVAGIFAIAAAAVMLVSKLFLKKSWHEIIKYLAAAAFIIYILAVTYATLLHGRGIYNPRERMYNLIPFKEISDIIKNFYYRDIELLVINIITLVPFGFLFPIVFEHYKKLTVLFGALFSLVIEITQFVLTRGVADIDDIIDNTLGAAIGFGLYLVSAKMYKCVSEKQAFR